MTKRKTKKIIMKFGGTSVGSPEAVKRLIGIVTSSKEPVAGVVVSAFSQVTNQLIQAAELASTGNRQYKMLIIEITDRHRKAVQSLIIDSSLQEETLGYVEKKLHELESILKGVSLIKEVSPKILDTIMSYGERLSAYIITQSFINSGVNAEYVDAPKFIKTDATFGSAKVNFDKSYENIQALFRKSKKSFKIITGYIGSTEKYETTTFGRGGSDYTASIFGAALNVSKIEIWTDVDGVMTADPRKVPSAFTIKHMTYLEAMEMSHFGAKVIYPQTMIPAYTHNIPMVIRNTFNPDFAGTIISNKKLNGYLIKGISSMEKVSLILVQGSGMRGTPGFAARLFNALAQKDINIILITQASSEYSICLAVNPTQTQIAKDAIEEEFHHEIQEKLIDSPRIEDDLSIIAVVGESMRNTIGISGKLFTTLADSKINVRAVAQGSSERNISLVVAKNEEAKAILAIHKTFFEK